MEMITHGMEPYYRFAISYREIERRRHELSPILNELLKKQTEESEYDEKIYFVGKVEKNNHNELAMRLFNLRILLRAERAVYPAKK